MEAPEFQGDRIHTYYQEMLKNPRDIALCCASPLCLTRYAKAAVITLMTKSTSPIIEDIVQSIYSSTRLLFNIPPVPYDVQSIEASRNR